MKLITLGIDFYKFQLSPLFKIPKKYNDFELVNISIGRDNAIYILLVDIKPALDGEGFVKVGTKKKHNYKVLICVDEFISEIDIPDQKWNNNQKWNYHYVQPIGNNNLLLVCGRSAKRSKEDFDLNAAIFDYDGKEQKRFLLGDGIQDVQVTSEDIIWTSYFDEGVFGNYGWGNNPIGKSGLVSWDKEGKMLSEQKDFRIYDCYALNVDEKNIWFYYYDEFKLVHMYGDKHKDYKVGTNGSDGFAISDKTVLMRGGYEERNSYLLAHLLKDGTIHREGQVEFFDENEDKIETNLFSNRKGVFVFFWKEAIYKVDVKEVLALLKR